MIYLKSVTYASRALVAVVVHLIVIVQRQIAVLKKLHHEYFKLMLQCEDQFIVCL